MFLVLRTFFTISIPQTVTVMYFGKRINKSYSFAHTTVKQVKVYCTKYRMLDVHPNRVTDLLAFFDRVLLVLHFVKIVTPVQRVFLQTSGIHH